MNTQSNQDMPSIQYFAGFIGIGLVVALIGGIIYVGVSDINKIRQEAAEKEVDKNGVPYNFTRKITVSRPMTQHELQNITMNEQEMKKAMNQMMKSFKVALEETEFDQAEAPKKRLPVAVQLIKEENPVVENSNDLTATESETVQIFDLSYEGGWIHDDFDRAQAIAEAQGKDLLVMFTGSDWCGACIRMDRKVNHTQLFLNFAKENFVLVKLDYPRKKAQTQEVKDRNNKLRRSYRIRYYPTYKLMKANGKSYGGFVGGVQGPKDMIARLKMEM